MKIKPTEFNVVIRPLLTIFRIEVEISLEKNPDDPIGMTLENIGIEGDNHSNFMLLDNRRCEFPNITLYWDVELDDPRVDEVGYNEFCNYYLKQVNTTLRNKSMALINAKNSDMGLAFLAQIKLNLFEEDEDE